MNLNFCALRNTDELPTSRNLPNFAVGNFNQPLRRFRFGSIVQFRAFRLSVFRRVSITGLLRVVDFYLFMYRNRAVKGFVSPLIVQPSAKENEVSACQEKAPSDLVRKPLRSKLQILNLFEKVIQQNEIERDNVQVKNNPPTKRDASSPIREEKTSAVDSPQTAVKM